MELIEATDQGAQYPFRHVAAIPALQPIIIALHFLGHPLTLLIVLLVAVAVLAKRGLGRLAILLAVVVVAAVGTAHVAKIATDRTRPNLAWRLLEEPPTMSFPSAHAFGATALYVSIGMLIARRVGSRRPLIVGIVLAFLAGIDRMLIGHNFLTDVLAGWMGGALFVAIFSDREQRLSRETAP